MASCRSPSAPVGSRQPWILAAAHVLAPGLLAEAKVVAHERDQVSGRFAGQDSLHDVLVRRVALGFFAKNPGAGLAAKHVAAAGMVDDLRGVFERRAAAQNELAEVAKADGRRAVREPLELGPTFLPAFRHLLPDGVELGPRSRIF